MKERFSANLGFLWKDRSVEERVRRAAAAGFGLVEFHDEPQRIGAPPLRRLLDRLALRAVALNSFMGASTGRAAIPGQEEKARADIAEAIACAAAIGAGSVHVTAGRVPATVASRATYAGNLAFACDAAAGAGLTVLIEPISQKAVPGYFLGSLEQAAGFIETLARPNLKLLFDCFHVHAMEHDLLTAFARHAPMIGHVQIAGVPGRNEPEGGTVDWPRLLRAFCAAGYGGPFGCEYTPRAGVEEGLQWREAFA